MKRLIIAKTNYQIIFAMQMKNTIFKDDYVTMLVCDHSIDADIYAARLNELQIFSELHFVVTMGACDVRTKRQKIEDFFDITFRQNNRYRNFTKSLVEKKYDEMIVYNYTIETYGIHALLSQYNRSISVSRYEEGILSYNGYNMLTGRRKLINNLRKIQGKPSIEDCLKNFYCFYPQLYQDNLIPCFVPLIKQNDSIIVLIKKTFNVGSRKQQYNEKYIFFTSVYDFEGGKSVGEYELVCKIADLVGKNNLLVKTHPRDTRTIYIDNGFNVDENSAIPWEAIQLSGDFSGKIFMTLNSGSVLAGSTMSEKPIKTYFMYKLCDFSENSGCLRTVSNIKSLLSKDSMQEVLRTVKIAEKIEDIL